jgi:hypothetical protein
MQYLAPTRDLSEHNGDIIAIFVSSDGHTIYISSIAKNEIFSTTEKRKLHAMIVADDNSIDTWNKYVDSFINGTSLKIKRTNNEISFDNVKDCESLIDGVLSMYSLDENRNPDFVFHDSLRKLI